MASDLSQEISGTADWPARDGRGSTVIASDADLHEFRRNMALVRRSNRGPAMEISAQVLALPLAIRQAIQGILHYGPAVRRRDNASLRGQAIHLVSDYFRRIRISDFYMYRLYLPDSRLHRDRVLGFSQVLDMQQYLIASYGSQDYSALREKHIFARQCAKAGLPTAAVLAEFMAGEATLHSVPFPPADLFSKPSDLMLGLGSTLWRYEAPDMYVHAQTGDGFDGETLVGKLCQESLKCANGSASGRILLQAKQTNHAALLGTLTTGGLSTVRVVTCRTPSGSIDLLPAVIRMPVGAAIADNIAQGGLAAPVDMGSGRICGPAIRKDKQFGISTFERHPSTGVTLNGFPLPHWQQVPALALAAHQAFPSLHFIGWDIAILQQGPVLLEGNAWWDVDLTVLPHRLTLSDTQFIPYYNHHFRNRPARP